MKQQPDVLKVMTFNLRTPNARDGHPWEIRRPIVKQLVHEEAPSIIGTQEGTIAVLREMQADLPEYDWIGEGRDGGLEGEFMAVFYKTAHFKPIEHGHFWLSDTPDIAASTSWGNRIPRMATWVKFENIANGRLFYFMNTHLDHQSEEARLESARLIVNHMTKYDADLPIILTGDFNAPIAGEVYQVFINQGQMKNAVHEAMERRNDQIGTFHGYRGEDRAETSRIIDWILYSGDMTVSESETITYSSGGQYPSDHFPVAATFTFL